MFQLAEIRVPLSQLSPQTPLSHFLTQGFSFVSELIQAPFVCFLMLKTLFLTCPLASSPRLPKASPWGTRALPLVLYFFLLLQFSLQHFAEANEWETCLYPSAQEFFHNSIWKCFTVIHNVFLMNEPFLQKTYNIRIMFPTRNEGRTTVWELSEIQT